LTTRTRSHWMLYALLLTLVSVSPVAAQGERNTGKGDMGVALAMQGEASRAESVFVSMLSHTRGDARALNGLGNLRLLRGDVGVAMAFYDRALKADSSDAGIHLNRATALMLMGDEVRAREAAQTAIHLAGSLSAAQALLGLAPESGQPSRAADKSALLSKDEIRAMLRSAASAVPSDTGHASPGGPAITKKHPPQWRSAGPRAADPTDNSSSSSLLYWKK
jgi:tetratricopeptide (TPR) repeat protein